MLLLQPNTIKAFQRVKVDDVVFTDERLKDNSYWAKVCLYSVSVFLSSGSLISIFSLHCFQYLEHIQKFYPTKFLDRMEQRLAMVQKHKKYSGKLEEGTYS